MKSIEEQIASILSEDFKFRPESIGSDTTFAALGFDSLVIVELALILGKEFGVALGDDELVESMTITNAAELIASKEAAVRMTASRHRRLDVLA